MVSLPPGETVLSVKLINPVNFGPSVLSRFMAPAVPGLETFKSAPSLSFLLEHPSGRKFVWDLGIRKDYTNYAPSIVRYIPTTKYDIQVEKDVVEILQDGGIAASEIEGVFWSHWHWDHIGNPDSFPKSTDLIVGRGFKEGMLPGAPANPDSPIQESDYEGRRLREISFDGPLVSTIGKFPAFDFFGDGSFYILDSPGHAIGHMCGLARTSSSPDSFILLGGDVCHYAGIFRPSVQVPIPLSITPHPCVSSELPSLCPGAAWEELQHSRGRSATDSLYDMTYGLDIPLATTTRNALQELDCLNNVFVIIAHDASIRDGVKHFPHTLNNWMADGLGQKLRWDFLRELEFHWIRHALC